ARRIFNTRAELRATLLGCDKPTGCATSSVNCLLPDDVRKREAVRELAGYGCVTQMHLVPLMAPRLENENYMKDIDFTQGGIGMRREAGYKATMQVLERAPWQGEVDPIEGVILHEAKPDLAVAGGIEWGSDRRSCAIMMRSSSGRDNPGRFATAHESGNGTSRHFAAARQFSRLFQRGGHRHADRAGFTRCTRL